MSPLCLRGSLDRRSPLRQLPPEHNLDTSSSANVSNLNLTLPISASVISIEKSRPNDGTSTFELTADCPLQSLSPTAPSALLTVFTSEGYHYWHTSEGSCKKKHEVGSLSVEHTAVWLDWGLNEGQGCERAIESSVYRALEMFSNNNMTRQKEGHLIIHDLYLI